MDIKTVRKQMPVLSQDQSENKNRLTWCKIFSNKEVWCIIIKVCVWGKFTSLYCIRKWNINTNGNILSDQISHKKQSLYIYSIKNVFVMNMILKYLLTNQNLILTMSFY